MTNFRNPTAACAALALGVAFAPPAGAALDDHTLKIMGGTYAADCARADAPRVIVGRDEIVVLDGKRKRTAPHLETAASWYGENHAESYRVVLLSRVNDDPGLVFAIHEDEKGYYGVLDHDLTGIRPEIAKLTFRRCTAGPDAPAKDAAAKETVKAEAKPAPPPPAAAATAGAEATTALRADKNFRAAYARAMGPLMRERWIAVLDGPAPPSRTVTLGGIDYVTVASCKAHECAENNLVVAWSAARKTLYGLVRVAGENTFVGAPPVAVAEGLQALWQDEWGGGAGAAPDASPEGGR